VRRGSVGRSRTVAQQTLRTAPSSKAFVETFTGRLQALAQAHNLLLAGLDRRRSWRACQGTARAVLPRRPGAAQHRGAQSNALSATSQRAWSRAARARHQRREIWRPIQWHRQGQPFVDARTRPGGSCLGRAQGPPVVPPQRKGLGTKLIQRGLPDATIDWRFEAEGVVCAIDLPLAKLQPKNGSATRVSL
jgi:two-component system, chemotaxis family, CheB/CheR fusion protein